MLLVRIGNSNRTILLFRAYFGVMRDGTKSLASPVLSPKKSNNFKVVRC